MVTWDMVWRKMKRSGRGGGGVGEGRTEQTTFEPDLKEVRERAAPAEGTDCP